jgi:hypothetical protein
MAGSPSSTSGGELAPTGGAGNPDAADEVEGLPGEGIIVASFAGTGAFVAAATVAAVFPDRFARSVAYFDGALFAIGVFAFLWAYWAAVQRSRTDDVSVAGVYLLMGSTPRVVRFRLLLALAVEVVAALTTALIRPDTPVAFGVLVPMFGLGLAGLWGARHGTFPPRRAAAPRDPA